jgi:hypothetical protein
VNDIKIDGENYGLEQDGVQVQSGPVLPEWRTEANESSRALKDVIAEKLGVSIVSTVSFGEAEAAAPHEHPEYLTAVPEHDHPFQPHVHMLRDEDEARVKGIEQDVKVTNARLLQITGELRGDILTHDHRGYSSVLHGHDDLKNAIELVDSKLLILSKHEHDTSHAHPEINDLLAQIVRLQGNVRDLTAD